jgi:hypothetical protein
MTTRPLHKKDAGESIGRRRRVRVAVERALRVEQIEYVDNQYDVLIAREPRGVVGVQRRRIEERRTRPEAVCAISSGAGL